MIDKIDQDLKQALLKRDAEKVMVLRGLKSSIKNEQIKKRDDFKDKDIMAVLRRESKQREEAAIIYEKGGAIDRAQKERSEKVIIDSYLPKPLSESELEIMVEKTIKEMGNDKSKMGAIIGQVISSSGGRADGSLVSDLVRKSLVK